jgi:hypothetical protein
METEEEEDEENDVVRFLIYIVPAWKKEKRGLKGS